MMRKKSNRLPVQYGTHRLVNKRTGKLASSTSWILDLAACAVALGHSKGLPTLLPQQKAIRLLRHNELRRFKAHAKQPCGGGQATSQAQLRTLAEQALPAIAAYYTLKIIPNKTPIQVNRKGFVNWIVREMSAPGSGLNLHLLRSVGLEALAETVRGERWWLDRLRMQSK